jgi:hypothetical protein
MTPRPIKQFIWVVSGDARTCYAGGRRRIKKGRKRIKTALEINEYGIEKPQKITSLSKYIKKVNIKLSGCMNLLNAMIRSRETGAVCTCSSVREICPLHRRRRGSNQASDSGFKKK